MSLTTTIMITRIMTRKNDLMDDARHHYFSSDQPKGSGLLSYANGYKKGFQMALYEVRAVLDKCSNNLERVSTLKNLIKEVEDG